MPNLSIALLTRDTPQLAGKPIIMATAGGRTQVHACSKEAAHMGVRPHMRLRLAKKLCPDAIIADAAPDQEQVASREVAQIIDMRAPLYEARARQDFFVDITGMEKWIDGEKWSTDLSDCIRRDQHLPLAMGISVNKLTSQVAQLHASNNAHFILSKQAVTRTLAPLSLRSLPELAPDIVRELAFMGIRQVKDLRQLERPLLDAVFGQYGKKLWQWARGIDPRPIMTHHLPQPMSEYGDLDPPALCPTTLSSHLAGLVGSLAWRLRQKGHACTILRVALTYSDFQKVDRKDQFSPTASFRELNAIAQKLFHQLWQRRQRIKSLQVIAERTIGAAPQISLFPSPNDRFEQIQQSTDYLASKYGREVVHVSKWKQ